ncbi:SWIM zinc finger family protein [Natronococcus wangiae]|uniref:SWIM zinc finger family protein n=1 Tax=Natronococcus wangiae TaxID=3068275 RepID=UPI00273FD985|nr:SWIM zinc finger family protein [Natronococcus sp. AD5]
MVTIEDGLSDSCVCPADKHYRGACKHRIAVAVHTSVLEAALNVQQIQELNTSELQAKEFC